MRRKGKGSASVVTLNLAKSPISGGFGVNIRHSRVNRRGKSTISATSQPYYVLPLDIRFFNTVEAALDGFLGRGGEVEGFGRGGSEVVEKLQVFFFFFLLNLPFLFNSRPPKKNTRSNPSLPFLSFNLNAFGLMKGLVTVKKYLIPCRFLLVLFLINNGLLLMRWFVLILIFLLCFVCFCFLFCLFVLFFHSEFKKKLNHKNRNQIFLLTMILSPLFLIME